MIKIPLDQVLTHVGPPFEFNPSRGGLLLSYDRVMIFHRGRVPGMAPEVQFFWKGEMIAKTTLEGMAFQLECSGQLSIELMP